MPSEDEEVVRRLKVAGAIVLAKTNTPEFACDVLDAHLATSGGLTARL